MTSNRLEYFDSLRGFAMLFVIYFHLVAYHSEPTSTVNELVIRWRMPLFFFVSGFFALLTVDNNDLYKRRIKNRLTKQLYPTIVVWAVFILTSWLIGSEPLAEYVKHGIYDPAKRGYWFTSSLVEVYILYACIAIVLFKLKFSLKSQGALYLGLSIVLGILYLTFFQSFEPQGRLLQIYSVLSVEKFICLIPFFFLGLACRCYQDAILRFLGFKAVAFAFSIAFIAMSILSPEIPSGETRLYFISRVFGLIAILSIFTCCRDYLDSTTALGRYLNRIGRNTLAIYLFHFFFIILIPYLFAGYVELKEALEVNWWIELPCVLLLSALIAELCLGIDAAIKRNNTFHKLIFNPIA